MDMRLWQVTYEYVDPEYPHEENRCFVFNVVAHRDDAESVLKLMRDRIKEMNLRDSGELLTADEKDNNLILTRIKDVDAIHGISAELRDKCGTGWVANTIESS